MKDYSKVIDFSKWPIMPEKEKSIEGEKDEMLEAIRNHFQNNLDALAKFQINDQSEDRTPDPYKSLFGEPDSNEGISPVMQAYINSKNNNKK